MNIFIRKTLVLLFILFVSFVSNAQNVNIIKNEIDFGRQLFDEMAKYNDTLFTTRQRGLIYIKFLIKSDGMIDGIKFTEKQPPVLLNALTKVLKQFKIDFYENWDTTASYVLPLSYDYVPELTLPITFEKLSNQSPNINPDSLMAYMNFDFNGFFNVEESQKNLWGIKCVLLPTVKIFRPITYHYGIEKQEKRKLKKPEYHLK